jgi:hypothetical protein
MLPERGSAMNRAVRSSTSPTPSGACSRYNVVQINILPQHDASGPGIASPPFEQNADGTYDFRAPREEYFGRAERMLQQAVARGMVPALVVLWSDYVPDTWLSQLKPGHVIPQEDVEGYVEYAASRFRRFNPIYLVAGDTADKDLHVDSAWMHYAIALETIRRVDPQALKTLHIWGPPSSAYDLPDRFLTSELIDFFMYQSGHGFDWRSNPYALPRYFDAAPVRKPVLNGEPCYEGIGHTYGRHDARSVRRSVWLSLLSGADAGITYGAHGVWCWHSERSEFRSWGENTFMTPFEWRTALRFPGAWDVAYARWGFEQFGLSGLRPADTIASGTDEARIAENDRACVLYASFAMRISVSADLSGYDFTMINLSDTSQTARPRIEVGGGTSTIAMPGFNSDVLLVGVRR